MAEIDDGWVLFSLEGKQFGLSIKNLKQMVVLKDYMVPPAYPRYVKGIITLRGQTVPVIDLRCRLGLQSSDTEKQSFLELMGLSKQDHINWLEELYRSVEEERPFKLATDPHECAFGKWYNGFEPRNPILSFHLKKFDAPHQRIHGIALRVDALVSKGKKAQAEELIQLTRETDLAEMIDLFDETATVLESARREVVLVMEIQNERCGFLVDEVCAVRDVPPESIKKVDSVAQMKAGGETLGVADVDGGFTIMLDVQVLSQFQEAC